MRICPTCSAYYADESLAFCLVDGTPLVSVDPGSEKWSEGSRAIEEKGNALRKQQRKLKWRRVLMSATTMVVAMVVVSVVTLNAVFYLKPSVFPVPTASPTPSPTPTPTPSPSPTPSPTPTPTPSPSPTPSPTPTPSPSPSPSPPSSFKIRGRVMSLAGPLGGVEVSLAGAKVPSTTTNVNGYYTFDKLPAGGNYTITPRGKLKFTESSRTVNNLQGDQKFDFFQSDATPTPSPTPECNEHNMNAEARDLVRDSTPGWERMIAGERDAILDKYANRIKNAGAELGRISYHIGFIKPCKEFAVTATYAWQVFLPGNAIAPPQTMSVQNDRKFICEKRGSGWSCH